MKKFVVVLARLVGGDRDLRYCSLVWTAFICLLGQTCRRLYSTATLFLSFGTSQRLQNLYTQRKRFVQLMFLSRDELQFECSVRGVQFRVSYNRSELANVLLLTDNSIDDHIGVIYDMVGKGQLHPDDLTMEFRTDEEFRLSRMMTALA